MKDLLATLVYYRPISSGMLIAKLKHSDVKTVKLLKGDHRYGIDKNHVSLHSHPEKHDTRFTGE